MQLELPFLRAEPPRVEPKIDFVRMRRARRYIIRVRPDGSLRVTIPRGGSRRDAETFVDAHRRWAERERQRVLAVHAPAHWAEGQQVLLRGMAVTLSLERDGARTWLRVGPERQRLRGDVPADLRSAAEDCLKALARRELVPRLHDLAGAHGLTVTRVDVRNQRSRWGSCSRKGAIALNFRLVQAPDAVRDYVLIHELMHIRQQNHSRRFWRLVEAACPDYREAERWLKTHGRSLF